MWFDALTLRLGRPLGGAATPFNSHATLNTNLVSYWKLDETSLVRYDSVTASANDLTDNNTVGVSPAGPSGTVASFAKATSETLSRADGAETVWGESGAGATVAFWVKPSGNPTGFALLFGRNNAIGYLRNLEVYTGNGALNLYASVADSDANVVATGGVTTLTDGLWNYVKAWYDPADKKVRISVNGGTAEVSVAAVQTALYPTTADVSIGGWSAIGGYFNGLIARMGVWNAVQDVSSLFNSGNGKAYADLTTAEKVGLVSYWNLDEVSDTRYDSVVASANDLTDNFTVTSVTATAGAMRNAAASFVAGNSEYLSKTHVASLSPGAGEFTFSAWFKMDSGISGGHAFSKGKATGYPTDYEFALYTVDTTASYLRIGNADNSNIYVSGFIALGTNWTYFVWWYDPAASKVYYSVNNGATVELATDASIGVTTGPLQLGRNVDNTGYYAGLVDEVAIWSRVLTAAERTSLYNAGAGLFY